jgi:signal transduction histidine kinase
MPTFAQYIAKNIDAVVDEFAAFARGSGGAAEKLSRQELEDHSRIILEAVAADMATAQSASDQHEKSVGNAANAEYSAVKETACMHAQHRFDQGFTLPQMVSEYRALRAAVIRRWTAEPTCASDEIRELVRFGEAIDEGMTAALSWYSERLEQSRNLLIGIMAHDLRGPLSAVKMSAEYLLRTDRLNAGEMRAAVRIVSSTDRMSGYVKDLLDFARTLMGAELPIARVPVSLVEVCEDVADEVRAAFPNAMVQVDILASPVGMWESGRLAQLLGNLAGNAIIHGNPAVPVTITLSQDGVKARIDVHNAGEPISAEELPHLFEPLMKGSGSRERRRAGSSGLGLGLYIAREIAVAHGGTLEVTSDAEQGTTFSVKLPMA